MEYEVIICFETHVELNTQSKLFCACPIVYGARPNSLICPVCSGQPGALPVLNQKAVAYCVRAGLALNCQINLQTRFARKNYFYPDLPKGYQISQFDTPFCENGFLEIPDEEGRPYPVGIRRIHLEEDAGKLVHSTSSLGGSEFSYVDYNRSGVPLLEIVGDHKHNPIRSVAQARVYLEKLRQTLRYLDISECTIEKGQFRCDVNVSLRPKGAQIFGNRTEIKNMASFKAIIDALEFEIQRQAEILDHGGVIFQETRMFDEQARVTSAMRLKEEAPDYRYFPDPDLLAVELEEQFIRDIRNSLPELPDQRVRNLIDSYQLPQKDALLLTRDRDLSDYFNACVPHCQDVKKLVRWITNDLFKLLNESGATIKTSLIAPENFAGLINLITNGRLTEPLARAVLAEMAQTGRDARSIIDSQGLQVVADTDVLAQVIAQVIRDQPAAIAKIKAGKPEAINFLVGQVMRATKGKADPQQVHKLIHEQVGAFPD